MPTKEASSKITNLTLVALAYMSLFTMGFLDNLRAPYFSSVMGDLSLNDVDGAFFYIIPSSFAFMGSLLSPLWTKRWSIRYSLLVVTLFLCFGFGLLPLASSFWSMIGLCAIYGLALGFSNVAQNVAVHEGASFHKRRQLFSGLHSMYALAAFSAPFLAGWLFEAGVQWHSTFRAASVGCFLIFAVSFFIGRKSMNRRSVIHHEKIKTKPPSQKELWLITAPLAFYLVGEMSLSTRLALHLERNLAYSKEQASFWLAIFFALFTLGRMICWGVNTTRWPQVLILRWSSALACLLYALGILISPVFLVLCGLALAPFFPIAIDWFSALYHEHGDRVTAVAMGFGSLTTLLMHFTLGQLSEHFGLQTALWIGPAGLLITTLSLTLSLKMVDQKKIAH